MLQARVLGYRVGDWQRLVLDRDEMAHERWEEGGQFPPNPAPEDEAAWQALVAGFPADSERAVELAQNEAWLESDETEAPGVTWRTTLTSIAVHNAYHLGKIVLLRQLLGVWSPPDDA